MNLNCDLRNISSFVPAVCTIFTFLFLLIFGRLFWNLRSHFLIDARFPRITIIAVFLVFYIAVYDIIIVDYAVCYFRYPIDNVYAKWFHSISHGVLLYYNLYTRYTFTIVLMMFKICIIIKGSTFLFSFLVIYRAFLVYQKWKVSNFRFKHSSVILTSSVAYSNYLYSGQQKLGFIRCNNKLQMPINSVYIFIRISSLLLAALYVITRHFREIFIFSLLSSIPWLVLIMFGIIVMWHARKVKEAMMCIRETWLVIASILVLGALNRLPLYNYAIFSFTHVIGAFIGV